MNYLNQPKWNIIALLVVVLIATVLVVNANFSNDREITVLVVGWLPLLIGIFTLILYGLSRLLFKRYNWIITLLGILFLLNASIQFFLK